MEEYIDILNEKGDKTGEIRSKSEIHKEGLWHQTVHIWLINSNDEILLQRRARNKLNFPDMWDISVAGHVSSGEELLSAALREVKEEIDLDIISENLEFIGRVTQELVLNQGTYFDNEFSYIYLIRIDENVDRFHMQEDEVQALQWVPISEFRKWVSEKRSDLVPHFEEFDLLLNKLK